MKKIGLFSMVAIALILSGCGKKENVDFNKKENVDFNKTTALTFHDLKLEIPEVFVNGDTYHGVERASYHYDYACDLYLSVSSYPESDIKEAVDDCIVGNRNFTYSEKNINGNNWSMGYENYKTNNQVCYVININDKEYSINYQYIDADEKKCTEALNAIEKSLKFD